MTTYGEIYEICKRIARETYSEDYDNLDEGLKKIVKDKMRREVFGLTNGANNKR
jgi:hypothetical protein